ncbi:MAG: helix-hairpin-helix domain-containing protein [Desulfobacteraceae bacterium]|jgi:DNA ligase (NAD+)
MIDVEALVARLNHYNQAYRSGNPLISDNEYDRLVEQLREVDPKHPYLSRVEPEAFSERIEVRHPAPMLSTEKAYTNEQLQRFVTRVQKAVALLEVDDLQFKVTPKLDGLAGRDDGVQFASRGNGIVGYEISSAFDKGVIPIGGRGQGLGEIVAVHSYFEAQLKDKFEHPRNMVVGIVSSDTLNQDAQKALIDGKVHFVPYSQLPTWQGGGDELLRSIQEIGDRLTADIDYPMDGVVVEVVNEQIKRHMGATSHHYRWQIAVKRKGETAESVVEEIQWQVGRTGNVTPVMTVRPINLSGATIRRVTAHHAGMVSKLGIGPGARIEVIRSGEVIPKLERVLEVSQTVTLPEHCPSCGHELSWKGDFLRCTLPTCPAQIEQRICHWFRILGSADWFGIKTVQKLVAHGYDSLEKVYALEEKDFVRMGFGPVQSKNLAQALATSRTKSVEDWRFLAALGIPDLGVGDSRRLLQHAGLETLTQITSRQIAQINGFGDITSRSIAQGISDQKETLGHLLDMGFNLDSTPLVSEAASIDTPIAGKKVVFTGKMQRGSRQQMQSQARRLGAVVQAAVSGSTDFLVCGEKVGASKLTKASNLGVEIMSEADYYRFIDREGA